jgi:hypothetical protein
LTRNPGIQEFRYLGRIILKGLNVSSPGWNPGEGRATTFTTPKELNGEVAGRFVFQICKEATKS